MHLSSRNVVVKRPLGEFSTAPAASVSGVECVGYLLVSISPVEHRLEAIKELVKHGLSFRAAQACRSKRVDNWLQKVVRKARVHDVLSCRTLGRYRTARRKRFRKISLKTIEHR